MKRSGIHLWWTFGFIASSVATKIGVVSNGYKFCIRFQETPVCSTDSQAPSELKSFSSPSPFNLFFDGDNCASTEKTCVYDLNFPEGYDTVWFHNDGCFYKDQAGTQKIKCFTKNQGCDRFEVTSNPYYRPEDFQPGPYHSRIGSNIAPKCPHPQGSRWNQYKTAPGGQEPKSRWNTQGEIPATEEEAQNIQPSDDLNPDSTGNIEADAGQTGISNVNTATETEQLQAANLVTGNDGVPSNDDFQRFIDISKRNEDRVRKPFTA